MSSHNNGKRNFYDILGVKKDATQEEIKKAYRKLSLQFHPDRNNNSQESTETYQEINSAYDVLSSETDRSNYDRQVSGANFFGQGNGHVRMEVNPADIFNFFHKNIFEQMNMGSQMNMGPMNMGSQMNMGPMNMGPMNMTMGGINLGDNQVGCRK